MIYHSSGYVFEARVDCTGRKGIKEYYNFFNNTATVVCGIDGKGKIAKVNSYTGKDGFIPLKEVLTEEDSMLRFMRSHRATYSIVGDAAYIARVRYNMKTKKVVISIYLPAMDIPIMCSGGKQLPGVSCKLLSTENKPRSFKVTQKLYDSMISGLTEQIVQMDWSTREKYLNSRM